VLDAFDEENILESVKRHSQIMNDFLNVLKNEHDFIGDVRGYGTMIGVEIVSNLESKSPSKDKAMKIISNARDAGLLLVNCGLEGNVIRFMGPLTTPDNQVVEAMEIFKESVKSI
jgi:4-aminobutyrate aminotransferase/(S)-3-amino-2-methylpropionate transaminase